MAPSDFLAPNFNTLVYPPFLSAYFGAITAKSFSTSERLLKSLEIIKRRVARSPRLAPVTSFSIKGFNSFAFGSVEKCYYL